jgi:hypothetical protein
MKFIYTLVLLSGVYLTMQNKQDNDHWKNAPSNGPSIYTIYFTGQAGYAVSFQNKLFVSTDNGEAWYPDEISAMKKLKKEDFLWSGTIHCSAMKTTDGGITWIPYSSDIQEHFCRVYLSDPNTGYQAAEEFLRTVSRKVFNYFNRNEIEILQNQPQQCTEYYRSENEGWALGWCIKDFLTADNLSNLK